MTKNSQLFIVGDSSVSTKNVSYEVTLKSFLFEVKRTRYTFDSLHYGKNSSGFRNSMDFLRLAINTKRVEFINLGIPGAASDHTNYAETTYKYSLHEALQIANKLNPVDSILPFYDVKVDFKNFTGIQQQIRAIPTSTGQYRVMYYSGGHNDFLNVGYQLYGTSWKKLKKKPFTFQEMVKIQLAFVEKVQNMAPEIEANLTEAIVRKGIKIIYIQKMINMVDIPMFHGIINRQSPAFRTKVYDLFGTYDNLYNGELEKISKRLSQYYDVEIHLLEPVSRKELEENGLNITYFQDDGIRPDGTKFSTNNLTVKHHQELKSIAFYDPVHPSSSASKLTARKILNQIQKLTPEVYQILTSK